MAVAEAVDWVSDGGRVAAALEILQLADGTPAPSRWLRERSRPGFCGRSRVLAGARLFGVNDGPCHRLSGRLCGKHGGRPTVCRVYPADLNDPLDAWRITRQFKACPPDAWAGEPFAPGGRLLDARPERGLISRFHATTSAEQDGLLALLADTGRTIGTTPSEAELVLYPLTPEDLAAATPRAEARPAWWRVYVSVDAERRLAKRAGLHVADGAAVAALGRLAVVAASRERVSLATIFPK